MLMALNELEDFESILHNIAGCSFSALLELSGVLDRALDL